MHTWSFLVVTHPSTIHLLLFVYLSLLGVLCFLCFCLVINITINLGNKCTFYPRSPHTLSVADPGRSRDALTWRLAYVWCKVWLIWLDSANGIDGQVCPLTILNVWTEPWPASIAQSLSQRPDQYVKTQSPSIPPVYIFVSLQDVVLAGRWRG